MKHSDLVNMGYEDEFLKETVGRNHETDQRKKDSR